MNELYFIGIDGGATTTTGVIINNYGETLGVFKTKGTNLNIYKNIAVKRVVDFIKKIEELEISVNIIIGSNDKIIPNIDASQLKKINYFKLENCGHMAHIEKSNEVNKIILHD